MRSLQAIVFQTFAIPAAAVFLILVSVIYLSLRIIYIDIVDQQRLLIENLVQQSNHYLVETERLMVTIADIILDLPGENQTELLLETRQNYARFVALYLLNDAGQVILENTDTASWLGSDLSGEDYFQRARDSGQIYFSAPFLSLTSGQTSMIVAMPIFAGDRFRGVLVGEFSLALLQQQIIEQADLGEKSISFIVDQGGTLLAHPNRAWVQERRYFGDLPLVQAGLAGAKTVQFFYDEAQQDWLIGSVAMMDPGWVVVTSQPVTAVTQPLLQMLVTAGVALGLSLVIFFVGQQRSLRQITGPISHLAKKADAVARGEYQEMPGEQMGHCGRAVQF